MSVGHKAVPPPEIMMYMVAKEFGIPPWKLLDEDAADILTTYAILAELQPKPQSRGNKSGI